MDLVTTLDDFFLPDDLEAARALALSGVNQRIISLKDFTSKIWERYCESLQMINSDWLGLYEDVTLTNSATPIRRHRDQVRNEARHKILVYLNEVENGGTIFYLPTQDLIVANRLNRLAAFDISLYHQSQTFSGVRKLVIGFRPVAHK
jgi:hypothetical protein